MTEAPFPPPRPQVDSPRTDMAVDFPHLGFGATFRAHWDYADAAQQIMARMAEIGQAPQHGNTFAVGFTVYQAQQRAPGTFTITAPAFSATGTPDTDDLSEALWIHAAHAELAERTGIAESPTVMHHMIEISPAARAALGDASATFVLFRLSPAHPLPTGATHSGWTITLKGETVGGTAVEQISGTELAHEAPELVTAMALPMNVMVKISGGTFIDITEITRPTHAGAPPSARTVLSWAPPDPERVTLHAHGIEFFTEVDPEYRAEALQILQVVNQRTAADFVDNYALNFGMTFLVFRTEGEGRMRVKTTDVSQPGTAHSTPDLTAAATLRRDQLQTNRMLGSPTWADVNNCQVTMRVHPGAFDGPQITMRRVQPEGNDSGWILGDGTGEPEILRAHEVRYRAPATAAYFPLPAGYQVTLRSGELERVLDGAGAAIWPRA